MVADALTKSMTSPQLMNLITTGFLFMQTDKRVLCRLRAPKYEYTEHDLVEMDT